MNESVHDRVIKSLDAYLSEANSCYYLNGGHYEETEWVQISKQIYNDHPSMFLFLSTSLDSQTMLENIHFYNNMLSHKADYSRVLPILPKYLKYAVEKTDNKPTQKVELLQEYCGIPINRLKYLLKERYHNKKEENKYRIELMLKLFKICCIKLANAEIVHGELFPWNIYYEVDSWDDVRFSCRSSLILADRIEGPTYRPKSIKWYNQFKYENGKALNKQQAIQADIQTLALSIYEIGLDEDKETMNIIYESHDPNKVLTYSNVLNMSEDDSGQMLLKCISSIVKGDEPKYEYKDIISMIDEASKEKLKEKIIIEETLTSKEIHLKYFKTILPKYYYDSQTLMKKLNVGSNFSSFYIIERNNKQFILKVLDLKENKKIDESVAKENFAREKNILIQIEKKAAEKEKGGISPFYILKRMAEIECDENEIAIQYIGLDISKAFKYFPKIKILLSVPHILNSIANTLQQVNMFHSDIRPSNMCLDSLLNGYLFDYNTSIIYDEIKQPVTKKLKAKINGFTNYFASPEILIELLNGRDTPEIIPFKCDLYSLSKSLICCIAQTFEEIDIINTFYRREGCPLIKEEGLKQYMKAKINKEVIYNNSKTSETGILAAQFYCEMNAIFIENVRKYKNALLESSNMFTRIMNLLADLCDPNYTTIYNSEKLEELTIKLYLDYSKSEELPADNVYNSQYNIYKIGKQELADLKNIKPFVIAMRDKQHQDLITYNEATIQTINGAVSFNIKPIIEFNQRTLPRQSTFVYHVEVDYPDSHLQLYSLGGFIDDEPSNAVYLIDSYSKKIIDMNTMRYNRIEFGVASWYNKIAVAGGFGNMSFTALKAEDKMQDTLCPLNNIEIYDTEKNIWEIDIQLKYGYANPAVVFHSNSDRLYIIGGSQSKIDGLDLNFHISDIIEVYDILKHILLQPVKIRGELVTPISNCGAFELASNFKDEDIIIVCKDSLLIKREANNMEYWQNKLSIWRSGNELKCGIEPFSDNKSISDYFEYESSAGALKFANDILIFPKYVDTIIRFDKKGFSYINSVKQKIE